MDGDGQSPQQEYQKEWQQQLRLQAAQKQAAWQQARQLVPGGVIPAQPWTTAPPGVNAPFPNPLLSRFPSQVLSEADPGNALAGFFMGQQGVGDNPMLMHALLGGEPGMSNV